MQVWGGVSDELITCMKFQKVFTDWMQRSIIVISIPKTSRKKTLKDMNVTILFKSAHNAPKSLA